MKQTMYPVVIDRTFDTGMEGSLFSRKNAEARRAARFEQFRSLCEQTVSPLMLEPWTPFVPGDIPGHPEIENYRNSRYQVQVRRYTDPAIGACVHLSIKLHDKCATHDWRDLQRIKNELLGLEEEAVEIYPAESRLCDSANQYHLWSAVGKSAPFGFVERLVTSDQVSVEGFDPSRQRPFEQEPSSRQTVVETPEGLIIQDVKK